MSEYTALTRGGTSWTPAFIDAIDQGLCIGCGRCFKVCSRQVLNLVEFEPEDDDDDDMVRMVMEVADADDCTGCAACSRVCSKNCISHAPLEVEAP